MQHIKEKQNRFVWKSKKKNVKEKQNTHTQKHNYGTNSGKLLKNWSNDTGEMTQTRAISIKSQTDR